MNTGSPSPSGNIVLVRLLSLHSMSRYGHWITYVFLLMVPVIAVSVFWNVFDDPQAQERLWRALVDSIWDQPDFLLAVIAMPFVLLYMAVEQPARLKDRIVINETGIAFQRPARWRLPFTPRAWFLPWIQLRKAELKPFGPSILLILGEGARAHRIRVDDWVASDTPPETVKLLMKQLLQRRRKRMVPEDALRLAEESPLVRALRSRNVTIQLPDLSSPLMFNLLKNRHAVMAMVLLVVIGLYGVVDVVLLEETYVGDLPWLLWTVAGVIVAGVSYRWLSASKMSFVITGTLAMMIGLDVSFAMYPGLLRLNQFTDPKGPQAHEYVLREYVRFEPLESRLPIIEFERGLKYWSQFKAGSSYTFYLRQGGLGFYQLDLVPVHSEMRAFYLRHENHSPSGEKVGKDQSSI